MPITSTQSTLIATALTKSAALAQVAREQEQSQRQSAPTINQVMEHSGRPLQIRPPATQVAPTPVSDLSASQRFEAAAFCKEFLEALAQKESRQQTIQTFVLQFRELKPEQRSDVLRTFKDEYAKKDFQKALQESLKDDPQALAYVEAFLGGESQPMVDAKGATWAAAKQSPALLMDMLGLKTKDEIQDLRQEYAKLNGGKSLDEAVKGVFSKVKLGNLKGMADRLAAAYLEGARPEEIEAHFDAVGMSEALMSGLWYSKDPELAYQAYGLILGDKKLESLVDARLKELTKVFRGNPNAEPGYSLDEFVKDWHCKGEAQSCLLAMQRGDAQEVAARRVHYALVLAKDPATYEKGREIFQEISSEEAFKDWEKKYLSLYASELKKDEDLSKLLEVFTKGPQTQPAGK